MKKEDWEVSDEQVFEKTGKNTSDWIIILDKYQAADKKSNDVVNYLQQEFSVPRYWARTLTTHYIKSKDKLE